MPRRVVDGDKIMSSWKLQQVQPEEYRIYYVLFLTFALANGVFECHPAAIYHKTCIVFESLTLDTIQKILDEYERVGLLFRWKEPDASEWGYWTGIHSPGLLPPQSQIDGRHYAQGPQVPQGAFWQFCLEKNIRTNGHGPAGSLKEREAEKESRYTLSEKIKKLRKDKEI